MGCSFLESRGMWMFRDCREGLPSRDGYNALRCRNSRGHYYCGMAASVLLSRLGVDTT